MGWNPKTANRRTDAIPTDAMANAATMIAAPRPTVVKKTLMSRANAVKALTGARMNAAPRRTRAGKDRAAVARTDATKTDRLSGGLRQMAPPVAPINREYRLVMPDLVSLDDLFDLVIEDEVALAVLAVAQDHHQDRVADLEV